MSTQARIEWTETASRVSQKRAGKRERMLARLQAGPCRTWELLALGGSGMSGRLHEIREDLKPQGLTVKCDQDEDGGVYTIQALFAEERA